MSLAQQALPRPVRPAQSPLGLYVRTARGDARSVHTFLELRGSHFHGVVIDACRTEVDKELREAAAKRRLDVILDPRTQESALPGAFSERLGKLPWGVGRAHICSDFVGASGKRKAEALARFALTHGFTKVLTPSHFLRDHSDQWLEVDVEMASRLREELDSQGGKHVPVAYSLAIPYSVFRDADELALIIERLKKSVETSSLVEFRILDTAAAGPIVINHRIDRFLMAQPLTWEGVGVFYLKDGKIKEWSDYTIRVQR